MFRDFVSFPPIDAWVCDHGVPHTHPAPCCCDPEDQPVDWAFWSGLWRALTDPEDKDLAWENLLPLTRAAWMSVMSATILPGAAVIMDQLEKFEHTQRALRN